MIWSRGILAWPLCQEMRYLILWILSFDSASFLSHTTASSACNKRSNLGLFFWSYGFNGFNKGINETQYVKLTRTVSFIFIIHQLCIQWCQNASFLYFVEKLFPLEELFENLVSERDPVHNKGQQHSPSLVWSSKKSILY